MSITSKVSAQTAAGVVIRERVEVAPPTASPGDSLLPVRVADLRDGRDSTAEASARTAYSFCLPGQTYGLSLAAVSWSGRMVDEGYDRIIMTNRCGFDPAWHVRIQVELYGQGTVLPTVAAGLVDADQGTVSAPVQTVVMTQEDFADLGVFVIGREAQGIEAVPTTAERRFRLIITPVLITSAEPVYGEPMAQSFGWVEYVEPYTLVTTGAGGMQGSSEAVSAYPVGTASGVTGRFHPLSDVWADLSLTGAATTLGGLCAYGSGTPCGVAALTHVRAATLFGYVPRDFLTSHASPLDDHADPPPTYLLDGPKDATLAAEPAVVGALSVVVHVGSRTDQAQGNVTVGGYRYRLEYADGSRLAVIPEGDSVAVVVTPVYADGEPVTVPDDFLLDFIRAQGQVPLSEEELETYLNPPPADSTALRTRTERTAASAAPRAQTMARSATSHTAPSVWSDYLDGPLSACTYVRVSVAGASPTATGPGPWVGGVARGDGCGAVDVPYGQMRAGEIWIVAGEPPEGYAGELGSIYLASEIPSVEAYAYLQFVTVRGLTVTATPDTVWAGSEIRFTVEGDSLDPATPVTFSVPDSTLGGFAADVPVARGTGRRSATVERVLSVTRPFSDVSEIRFIAADEAPDSLSTVIVTVTADGRSGNVNLVVFPAPLLRLIRQNDRSIPADGPSGYVMVSKVRPDWLLAPSVPFATPYGSVAFGGNGDPDDTLHYDPDTYRPQLIGAPDSLLAHLPQFRFRYDVLRDGVVQDSVQLRSRSTTLAESRVVLSRTFEGAAAATDSVLTFRALRHVRLVSEGRPPMNQSSDCSSWPPSVDVAGGGTYQVPGDGGACEDDDDFHDEVDIRQTIPVRLMDTLRVTVYVKSADGTRADTLGTVSYPVGRLDEGDGYDAVRRVSLVWHEYENATGTRRYVSRPDSAAARMSEDWAQGSIFFTSQGQATPFRSADLRTIARIQIVGGGGATQSGTFEVRVPPLITASLPIAVAQGDSARAIAGKIQSAINNILSITPYAGAAGVVQGASDKSSFYVAISDSLADRIQVNATIGNVVVVQTIEQLDSSSLTLGSQAATAAGVAVAAPDRTVVNSLVVPLIAIQQGDSTSLRLAYAPDSTPTPLLIATEEAAAGDGRVQPHTLSHEAGHLLFILDFSEAGGGVECGVEGQAAFHHASPTNLLFCVALEHGQRIGGPKRLTPLQHRELRDQQLQLGSRSLLKRP